MSRLALVLENLSRHQLLYIQWGKCLVGRRCAYADVVDMHDCVLINRFKEVLVGDEVDRRESAKSSMASSFNALLQCLRECACATSPKCGVAAIRCCLHYSDT